MVDATVSKRAIPNNLAADAKQATPVVNVDAASNAMLQQYRDFASKVTCGAAQHPEWVESWTLTRSTEILFLSLSLSGQTVMMMPLEVVRQRGCRIARAIGGNHANGNFPPISSDRGHLLMPQVMKGVLADVYRLRPDLDLILIERQTPSIDGVSNPFAQLASVPSANVGLALHLGCGFDAILDRIGRKRRLKKHRSQTRKLDAEGGFRRIEAQSDAEVERLVAAFLQQKAERFEKLGIHNVFADMRPFLNALFSRAQSAEKPAFLLHGLEVAGTIRAVTGASVVGDRIICEFGSIAEDDLSHASPGDFLFYLNIEDAARQGFKTYDFSVGDEAYKRGWCDIETEQFDTIAPLTLKGRAYALALQAAVGAKRRIKGNARLMAVLKRLRRGAANAQAKSPSPADSVDD